MGVKSVGQGNNQHQVTILPAMNKYVQQVTSLLKQSQYLNMMDVLFVQLEHNQPICLLQQNVLLKTVLQVNNPPKQALYQNKMDALNVQSVNIHLMDLKHHVLIKLVQINTIQQRWQQQILMMGVIVLHHQVMNSLAKFTMAEIGLIYQQMNLMNAMKGVSRLLISRLKDLKIL